MICGFPAVPTTAAPMFSRMTHEWFDPGLFHTSLLSSVHRDACAVLGPVIASKPPAPSLDATHTHVPSAMSDSTSVRR